MKLPSHHQIGDRVRYAGKSGVVVAVTFTNYGKVEYDIANRFGVQPRVSSEHVFEEGRLTIVPESV